MFNVLKQAALIGLFVLVTSCATNQFSHTRTLVDGVSLKSTKLYIYSFLDIRDKQFGPNLLTQIDTMLTREMSNSQVTAKVLRFKDSETARYSTMLQEQMSVPVKDVIKSNTENERSFGAEFRLIVFPSSMTLAGAWVHYDVRWDLVDVKTGKLIWSTISQGKHMNAWKQDEDPEIRAKTIVDGIIAEMKNSKLL